MENFTNENKQISSSNQYPLLLKNLVLGAGIITMVGLIAYIILFALMMFI